MLPNLKIIILGFGYVGKHFEQSISQYCKHPHVDKTSRSQQNCIYFDFDDESTWENIAENYDFCLWTFPVHNQEKFKQYIQQYKNNLGKIILLGSTSAYLVTKDHQYIQENSRIDPSYSRGQVECSLLNHGGIVLRSAGIYGPNRNPYQWAQTGRVSPSERFINWVHVEDLIQFIWHAYMFGENSHVYIAADKQPTSWQAFFEYFAINYSSRILNQSHKQSKRIDNLLSMQELHIDLKYPNVLLGCANL